MLQVDLGSYEPERSTPVPPLQDTCVWIFMPADHRLMHGTLSVNHRARPHENILEQKIPVKTSRERNHMELEQCSTW
jgi:hypothetical protein